MVSPLQSPLKAFVQSPFKARAAIAVSDYLLMSSGNNGLVYIHNPLDLSRVLGPLDFRGLIPFLTQGVFNSDATRFFFIANTLGGGVNDFVACIDFLGNIIWQTDPVGTDNALTDIVSDGQFLYTTLVNYNVPPPAREIVLQKHSMATGAVVNDQVIASTDEVYLSNRTDASLAVRSGVVYGLLRIPINNDDDGQKIAAYSTDSLSLVAERDLGAAGDPEGLAYFGELGPGAFSIYSLKEVSVSNSLRWASLDPVTLADLPAYDWVSQSVGFSRPADTASDVSRPQEFGPFRFENNAGGVSKYEDDGTEVRATRFLNSAAESSSMQPAAILSLIGIEQVTDEIVPDSVDYARQIIHSGIDPDTWALLDPPQGFSISQTGMISATAPLTLGEFEANVFATTAATWEQMSYLITVIASADPPIIQQPANEVPWAGTPPAPYTKQMVLTQGAPVTWSMDHTGGTAPPNTSIDQNGLVTFDPTLSGGFDPVVIATNANGSDSVTWVILIL